MNARATNWPDFAVWTPRVEAIVPASDSASARFPKKNASKRLELPPDRFAAPPKRLEPLSKRLGTLPDRSGTLPDRLGTIPDRLGTLPKRLAGVPKRLGKGSGPAG